MPISSVLLVEPSSSGLGLIRAVRDAGLDAVVLTCGRDDRRIPPEHLRLAADVVVVDTNDEPAVVDAVLRLGRSLAIEAVIPGFEYHVPLAARLGARLGLRGLSPQAVDVVRYKDAMRRRLEARSVRIPRYAVVRGPGDLARAAEHTGFPCVLKPINLSGSIHVSRADDPDQLRAAYEAMLADPVEDYGHRPAGPALVEEYVGGAELSVEGYVQDGAIHVVSITEKLLGPEPHFVELGHLVQAELPPDTAERLVAYAGQVVRALDVTVGPFHCEIRLGRAGPIAMELGARLPGDGICDLVRIARGVDLHRIMVDTYLGRPVTFRPGPDRCRAGIRYFVRPGLASYGRITGVEALERLPGFHELGLVVPPERRIPEPCSSLGRIAYAVFSAPSRDRLRALLDEADRLLTFHEATPADPAPAGPAARTRAA